MAQIMYCFNGLLGMLHVMVEPALQTFATIAETSQ